MRKILLLTILLSIAFGQSPQQSANLKMPDGYKTVNLYFTIDDRDNIFSESAIISAVKLRLRQNGIKYNSKESMDRNLGVLNINLFTLKDGNKFLLYNSSLGFLKFSLMSNDGQVYPYATVYETPNALGSVKIESKDKVIKKILSDVDRFSADFLDANDL
jgi:hypothetical protein